MSRSVPEFQSEAVGPKKGLSTAKPWIYSPFLQNGA